MRWLPVAWLAVVLAGARAARLSPRPALRRGLGSRAGDGDVGPPPSAAGSLRTAVRSPRILAGPGWSTAGPLPSTARPPGTAAGSPRILAGPAPAPLRRLAAAAAGVPRRQLVVVVAASAAAGAVWWPAAAVPPLALAGLARLRARSLEAERRAVLAAELPDVVDLLRVAVSAGLNVRLAVEAVARRAPPGPLVEALRRAGDEVRAGVRLADALGAVPGAVGDGARPLVSALVDAERYGAPLAPTLDRVADGARLLRQRAAEEDARRVPVKLLFPLVTCILPAFGLLTVAPLIAGGLRALRLP